MCEETIGSFGRVMTVLGEVFCETIIGDLAGMGETVHAFADFCTDETVVDFLSRLQASMMSSGMHLMGVIMCS